MNIESCGALSAGTFAAGAVPAGSRSGDPTAKSGSVGRVSGAGRSATGQLSFVKATGTGCQIHRETTGRYVVSHAQQPQGRLIAATLAGAYAACRTWEQRAALTNPAV